eukprot:m.201247 g.201247  ORF g.201247 m.201247 type:complete len:233 (-) comp10104_c0_seq2:231-929(-)
MSRTTYSLPREYHALAYKAGLASTDGVWKPAAAMRGREAIALFTCPCGRAWLSSHPIAANRKRACRVCKHACRVLMLLDEDDYDDAVSSEGDASGGDGDNYSSAVESCDEVTTDDEYDADEVNESDEEELGSLSPPFPSAKGSWVRVHDYPGRKSFGRFYCSCGNKWMSAHAFKEDYGQDCRECDVSDLAPRYMWRNSAADDTSGRTGRGHHDTAHCGACRALGDCRSHGRG